MPYSIQQLNDLPYPTILNTISGPNDMTTGLPANLKDLDAVLAQIEGEQVYLIMDQTEMELTMGDLVQGLSMAFKPRDSNDVARVFDSRVRILLVGTHTLTKIVAMGAKQDQYGRRQLELFDTLDRALEHIRQAPPAGEA